MSASRTTGLGMPEPIGKKALFQPPAEEAPAKVSAKQPASTEPQKASKSRPPRPSNGPKRHPKRVRITTELTGRAMRVILDLQNRHRLETGKALPQWKVVSGAIEYYGESKGKR